MTDLPRTLYQLVLQFPSTTLNDFDKWIALEEILLTALSPSSCVDGHDCGSGEFNIFILTHQPEQAFAISKAILEQQGHAQAFSAAYRDTLGDTYTILWPSDLKHSISLETWGGAWSP